MRVLLVDHDAEGLEAIARAIRGVLELDCVTSKGDALLLMRQNTYDVLIACERAVDGSGLDLLGRTTRTTVPLKRIFAAAPERLQLLGPRLAPFKVQRTINYPIDLEELWLAIAQVTGGPNDETDGTIERVVLDERGIPSNGTTPRTPIPPRPPAPLREVRATPPPPPAPPPAPAIALASNGARGATARMVQPAPEPPLRAPPPPRAPPAVRPPAPQMRAPAPPMQPIPPMPMPPQVQNAPVARAELLPGWTPETPPEDDFAQVAAQARLGVQRKVVDEVSRRKRQRLLTAGGAVLIVAALMVFLIEKFYDPKARERERAIAAEVTRMTEQQKVTDNLTLIEIEIEKAIMNNDLDAARSELARLVEQSPAHPRREFLQASIDRAAELQKLAGQGQGTAPAQAATAPAKERTASARSKDVERAPAKTPSPDRVATRAAEKTVAPRTVNANTASQPRTYGAPISEPPRERTIALDAPINSQGTTGPARRNDNSFGGRTVEAGDSAVGRTPPPQASSVSPSDTSASGSAAAVPSAAPPASAPIDVVPAKIVKRVTPVVSADILRKTSGFVIVKFDITDSGRVGDIEVVESTPPGVFDDAALAAVRKWQYEPRKENGVPVTSQAKARLVFDLAK